ncbi:MAG: phosphate acyltransferase PlsX [Candidatus Pseudobacter hemicellulosilyticus]|uniref:Phosphate acyltransferase n=1 Tax=Candidatus Pseudobacter hemicellulosilyticus TaxID=3121375 RepID=A0AAJ5WNL4_9BACT|nr:MAG: phosphate acyltransferase PlsX [Pseudobacter sp.]
MTIGLDIMGGDFAPREAVKGIHLYLSETASPANLLVTGDEAQINPLLEEFNIPAGKVKVVHAPQVIDMHEHPTKALKEKQQSSIAIGFHLLATGKTDAFISAGNTGAMLVGAMYSIKAIEGVLRPTISTVIPKDNGKTGLLLDVGLNADCKPEQLNQFALLGSLYAKHILGIDNPRVALVNIGEEEGKGNILAQATYPLLKENNQINFVGNVEGRDVFLDKADVMVCEGFTGNVILKLAESIYEITHAKDIRHEFLERFNFENYGGTPVLGVAKPVIIGHGISQGRAFYNMILLAEKMIATDLMGKLKASFEAQ